MRNHTGTHLLHRALRNTVGDQARQAGSLVTPDYLRFDYHGDRALTDEEKRQIEAQVRGVVRDNKTVTPRYMSMAEAITEGADAFFDEKYGEQVRVVFVDGFSRELCGGTHCSATGQIGGFVITGERSIGSGMRRIEARSGGQGRQPTDLARSAQPLDGTKFISYSAEFDSMKDLQSFARALRAELGDGVIALGLEADEPQLFVTVSEDLVSRGVSAGALVNEGAPVFEGRGGGRPEMAQARGTRRDRLPSALTAIRESLEQVLRDNNDGSSATGNGPA
jgi:alanyl-tRNA synthetase